MMHIRFGAGAVAVSLRLRRNQNGAARCGSRSAKLLLTLFLYSEQNMQNLFKKDNINVLVFQELCCPKYRTGAGTEDGYRYVYSKSQHLCFGPALL
jgi:hypothetical protein